MGDYNINVIKIRKYILCIVGWIQKTIHKMYGTYIRTKKVYTYILA